MKQVISILWICILAAVCQAQPDPDTLWTRTFGGPGTEGAVSVRPTSDGNFIVAGLTTSFGPDAFEIVKFNNSGDTLWSRVLSMGNVEQPSALVATADGGFAIVGSIEYMDGGNTAILLIRTNSAGDTLWTRAYAVSRTNHGYAIQLTSDNGFLIAGDTPSANGDADVFLVRTNSAGDTLWTHVYEAARNNATVSVESTLDGGYILAGYNYLPNQATSGFLMKISATGTPEWRHEITGLFNMPIFATQASDGGYMVAGTGVPTGTLHLGPYLMKTDPSGNVVWTQLHSVNPLDELLYSATKTTDGGFVMSGFIGNIDSAIFGMEIVRMDSLGSVLWDHSYGLGTGATGASIIETADHGYLAVGNAATDANGTDMYLVRTGPEGLSFVYPDSGQGIAIGRPLDIRWNGAVHGGNVSIQINRNYPSGTWESVTATAPNSGHYCWLVSGPECDHARFRIAHLTNPALSDTTHGDLSLRIPGIHLNWPNGGETILSGVRDTVRFNLVLVSTDLRIQLNRDYPNGTWDPAVGSIGDDSTALWVVQTPGGTHCRLRVVSVADSSIGDTSDGDFVLRVPQMTLTSPNGGESLPAGISYNMVWSAPEHLGNVRISLNRDYPTGTWEVISANVPNNGQRAWIPTGPASDHCRIRISTILDLQARVESAADFAITAAAIGHHENESPAAFNLAASYPNPFNSQTVISYSIPERGVVSLTIYDLSGHTVKVITQGMTEGGTYSVAFDAEGLPSGMYFYCLQWGTQSMVRKMVLIK